MVDALRLSKEATSRFARTCSRFLLLFIVLIAGSLRLAWLGRPSLWYDEVVTLTLALQRGPRELLRLLPQLDATRAPLHPLLLQGWLSLFGSSDWTARSFSVLCGVLSVLAVYRIGCASFDRSTGLWAAWLCAISPLLIMYSQEARPYALLVLVTCLAWENLLSLRRSDSFWREVEFTACLVALGYIHPLGLLMDAMLAAGYLATGSAFQLSWRRWAAINLLAALGLAPWIGQYLNHSPENLPGRSLTGYMVGLMLLSGGSRWTTVAGILLITRGLFSRSSKTADEPSSPATLQLDSSVDLWLIVVWYVGPSVLIYIYSLVSQPIFSEPRYHQFVGPAFLLLVARGLTKLPLAPRLGLGFLATAIACWTSLGVLDEIPQVKADWRDAAAVIHRDDPDAPVIALADGPLPHGSTPQEYLAIFPLRYYLQPSARIIAVTAELKKLASDSRSAEPSMWYVVQTPEGIPAASVPKELAQRYKPTQVWQFPGLRLTHNRFRPSDAPDSQP